MSGLVQSFENLCASDRRILPTALSNLAHPSLAEMVIQISKGWLHEQHVGGRSLLHGL